MEPLTNHFEAVYEKARNYTETSIELYKLNAIDVAADVASALVLRFALVLVVSIFTLFVNVAISLFIGNEIGNYYIGFLIVSGFYLIVALLIYFFKEKLVKTPISNLVITALLKNRRSKQKDSSNDINS